MGRWHETRTLVERRGFDHFAPRPCARRVDQLPCCPVLPQNASVGRARRGCRALEHARRAARSRQDERRARRAHGVGSSTRCRSLLCARRADGSGRVESTLCSKTCQGHHHSARVHRVTRARRRVAAPSTPVLIASWASRSLDRGRRGGLRAVRAWLCAQAVCSGIGRSLLVHSPCARCCTLELVDPRVAGLLRVRGVPSNHV